MKKPIQCVISLSGGMDSGTLLSFAQTVYGNVLAVGFSYGSKHNKYELACAEKLCKENDVEFIQINLEEVGSALSSSLLKSGGDIPEGHYESENMKSTVVPGRNMIFASILAGIAESRKAPFVALGIHSGDHAIYPDCRPEFFRSMAKAIQDATDGGVVLEAPFLNMDKTDILKWGLNHKVPYQFTRTCYKDQPLACGKCGACQERLEAFRNLNTTDPIMYDGGNQ